MENFRKQPSEKIKLIDYEPKSSAFLLNKNLLPLT